MSHWLVHNLRLDPVEFLPSTAKLAHWACSRRIVTERHWRVAVAGRNAKLCGRVTGPAGGMEGVAGDRLAAASRASGSPCASEFSLCLIRSFAGGAVIGSLATEVFPKAFKESGYSTGPAVALGLLLALYLNSLG
ncbi:hypothetical protein BH23ACT6_BH23ACT6_10340 [soil metagenome]